MNDKDQDIYEKILHDQSLPYIETTVKFS